MVYVWSRAGCGARLWHEADRHDSVSYNPIGRRRLPKKMQPAGVRSRRGQEGRLAHDERCSTMAWEQRGSQTYYYRSIRRNGRVMKEYRGIGPLAALSAAEDAARRAQRQAEAEAWRQERAALDALDRQLDTYWNAATLLLKATLYIEGYYQHDRGEWRKRPHRGRDEEAPAESREGRYHGPTSAPEVDGPDSRLLGGSGGHGQNSTGVPYPDAQR